MHLKDLIEASKYHWPSTSSTASTNVNRKSSAGDGGGKVNSNNASSAIARQQSPFMYKFEFFPKLSDKAQQRSAVPSYASELENFSAQLLDTLIPQLKTKNEQWNAVEQLWRQTMGHTIDQLVADCNDIDSLRTEIDRYRLQTDDHEEDIVQCEKNVKIISGRLLSNLHDLFPKKLLECSKVLIPLLQSIFENLVEQLEAIHPQFTSPELPSMEALNQKNSLNEWFALSTLGRKNSLSRRASASGSINNGSISALSGVTEKKQQPERTQQSLLLSGKEHIATNSKVKFGNIPVTTSYSGGRNGNDAKSITLDTSSKSIVWGVGSNGGGADATSSFLTTPSSPFIQAIENSNSSLRFDSNSINTSSAGVGATLLAPRPSLMQRRPSPAPDLLFKSIGGKFTSEESNDSSDTSDYDDYSGYHSPYSPASGSMGFKVKMILPKNKEILPPSLLMSSSVAVRLNAEAASNTTTKVSFLPPELQTQTLAAGESNSNFGPSISATISSDDIDGSSSTGLLVAPRASLNLRRPSAAPDILKQQFSLFKQDGGRDEEESDEVYSSRSNDLASSAGSSLGKSGNVKQKFLSGGSISFQSDVNESSLFVIKDESNPDEGNNSTSITTATTPEPNISSQFTPDDHENKDSDIQNVAEASGKILEKDGGGEKFPDFATLSGYAMPQD